MSLSAIWYVIIEAPMDRVFWFQITCPSLLQVQEWSTSEFAFFMRRSCSASLWVLLRTHICLNKAQRGTWGLPPPVSAGKNFTKWPLQCWCILKTNKNIMHYWYKRDKQIIKDNRLKLAYIHKHLLSHICNDKTEI